MLGKVIAFFIIIPARQDDQTEPAWRLAFHQMQMRFAADKLDKPTGRASASREIIDKDCEQLEQD